MIVCLAVKAPLDTKLLWLVQGREHRFWFENQVGEFWKIVSSFRISICCIQLEVPRVKLEEVLNCVTFSTLLAWDRRVCVFVSRGSALSDALAGEDAKCVSRPLVAGLTGYLPRCNFVGGKARTGKGRLQADVGKRGPSNIWIHRRRDSGGVHSVTMNMHTSAYKVFWN